MKFYITTNNQTRENKMDKKTHDHIKYMADLYAEKRSDVSEMLMSILSGKRPNAQNVEHRYISWKTDGLTFTYDTLTTLIEYYDRKGFLHTITDIQYKD